MQGSMSGWVERFPGSNPGNPGNKNTVGVYSYTRYGQTPYCTAGKQLAPI